MSADWICACPQEERRTMLEVLASLDPTASCEFARDAFDLRRRCAEDGTDDRCALVGLTKSGVSDINIAAAIAADGRARRVVLVRRSPSGSLRSRAARAGIDLVINPDDLPGAAALREGGAPAEDASDDANGVAFAASSARASLPEGHAPVITFCSGRGGVGKTSIVACAAAAAAQWGMRVEAVDLDLSCGNLFASFGLPRGSDLSELDGRLPEGDDFERLGLATGAGVRVWGPCARPERAELALPVVASLIERLSTTSDLVLVDTSPTFTEAVATSAVRSDRVVLVYDQRPGALASLARTSGLAVRLGVARTRIAMLENRASPRARRDPAFGRAEVGLEAARGFQVFDGGAELGDFLAAGEVSDLVQLGSPATTSAAYCLAQLVSELGGLPDCEAARRALKGDRERRRWSFGKRREVG